MVVTPETMIRPDARPLYAQVKDILMKRINSRVWRPGQALPSEFDLAAELGVSQGTVRKALDALADASLVERKQGRGTFVIQHTSDQVLFKFFQIYDANGERVLPGTGKTRFDVRKAKLEVSRSLSIAEGDEVHEINRIRTRDGKPFMVEIIYLPFRLFPGLHQRSELPNTLYDMFQQEFGITIAKIQEDSTAEPATKSQAKELDVRPGSPLLKIDRIAFDIEDAPIERRISYCVTENVKYRARLS